MIYKIWFSRVNLRNIIKLKLLEEYSEKELFYMSEDEYKKLGLNEKQLINIMDIKYRKNNEKYLEKMEKENIRLLKYCDGNYSKSLKEIFDKPVYIFIKGNLDLLKKESYSIVGSRMASDSGIKVARKLAYKIAKENINVVSGLAIGIDSAAHIGALDYKDGKTIAVLGNGLLEDDMYPKSNLELFRKILNRNGLIVSEYIIGTKPTRYSFPARNRIISGLSKKLIVVEAGEKSGSLITVDFALEQGKDVYAVPRNVFDINSKGVNFMIKEGAKMLMEYEDLFD